MPGGLRLPARTDPPPPPLIGASPAFQAVLAHVSRAAPLNRPALVIGERGTGKELVAARLHFLSRRWDRPFIKLNCAALADSLLESELFGHEAGAFTGAVRRHPGRFELADGGSLFLDELAAASPRIQEKLLRVVEYGEFERVGGRQRIAVDVRLIAAANLDLPRLAREGKFRADLLDRLAFDVITLPPLRARPEDIPILADHFAIGMCREMNRPFFPGFSPGALQTLRDYPWPGNVRELRNVVERAVFHAGESDAPVDAITLDPFESPYRPHVPAVPAATQPGSDAPETVPSSFEAAVAAFERSLLVRALEQAQFHRGQAADRLGLGYDQFRRLLRKHGIS